MDAVGLQEVTRGVLADYYSLPLGKKEDFEAGVVQLTKVALKSLSMGSCFSDQQLLGRGALGESSSLSVQAKVKAFVRAYAGRFGDLCHQGFPFATIEGEAFEGAFERSLNSRSSIVVAMMRTVNHTWLSKEDLEARCGAMVRSMQLSGIGKACLELFSCYQEGDFRAGYPLLWLLNCFCGASIPFSQRDTWDRTTVCQTLQQFFASESVVVLHPERLLQLLLFRSMRTRPLLYQLCFSSYGCIPEDRTFVHRWMLMQLQSLSIEQWLDKGLWVMRWFEVVDKASKEVLAKALMDSQDEATAHLGKLLWCAEKASSLSEALPHLYSLLEHVPDLSTTDIELAFRWPFVSFLQKGSSDDGSKKRLSFNQRAPVFVHENLMIGVYKSPAAFRGEQLPPYLLAYDMRSEKMVWGVPLVSLDVAAKDEFSSHRMIHVDFQINPRVKYELTRIGNEIAFHSFKDRSICLIDMSSGVIRQKVPKWKPLSTRVKSQSQHEWKIVGLTGRSIQIQAESAAAFGKKLYVVKNQPSGDCRWSVAVYTLLDDDKVISGLERQFSIKSTGHRLSIEALLQDRVLLLQDNRVFEEVPIFLDLSTGTTVYGEAHSSDGCKFINEATGEIWWWQLLGHQLKKISSQGVEEAGILESSRGTSLVHVDASNNVYYTDIPY